MQSTDFDAFLLVSFGGPEAPDHVLPYLDNVLAGKNVPEARKLEVAEHYYHFGGISPINAQNRALLAAIVTEFHEHDIQLPVYWGNRNWHPMLPDVLAEMADDGIGHALALVTSPYSSYSGCRQYLEDIAVPNNRSALRHRGCPSCGRSSITPVSSTHGSTAPDSD